MELERRRQAMLQLHLSGQQFNCLLRGGMAPCRVIFHENVNFLFVVQKCQVIHAFHKTHKQNVFAVIEIHTSGNFINNMVFGDQRVSTKNEDGEQHSVQYFGKFIQITGKLYI